MRVRVTGIDALRGVAVLLMVEQHLGYWLWKPPPGIIDFYDYPFLLSFNALGGFAAPIFVTLAGLGIVFFEERHERVDGILICRGCIILLMGYLLNLITPSWFSCGSWYVLHMIGFAMIIAPLFRRLSVPALITIGIVVLIATVFIQNALDTPPFLSTERMRRLDIPGGFLRLALAEGQFPVFPWLYFFLIGMIAGRWLRDDRVSPILSMAIITITAGVLLPIPHILGIEFAVRGPFHRFFQIALGFYPAHPPIVLLLSALVLLCVALLRVGFQQTFGSRNVLVCLGRTSLTMFFVHVFVFRELSHHLHFWQVFSTGETLLLISGVWSLIALASFWWQKSGYRFGAEWLLRRVSEVRFIQGGSER